MNKYAIYHKSDSVYSFALTPDTVELRLRVMKGDAKSVKLIYGMKHKFCQKQTSTYMQLQYSDELFDYFTVRLKLTDKRLAYVFYIEGTDGEKCYYSEIGATATYDFAFAYLSFFQLAYINENDVMPKVDWLSKAVVYQIFTDRFFRGGDGDKSHITMKWGDKPTPWSVAGGDLWGIIQKLDYICDLGVNTLYLTPIFTSNSNHKYDTLDYCNVDPRFGGNDAFRALMTECRKRGVRVILDAVFNHCSDKFHYFLDVCKNGKSSEYYDWFIIHGDRPIKRPLNYETFSSCEFMPKWNTANPKVQEYLCRVGEYWIKEYDVDGWRLDVSDEVSHEFWRLFRRRIKALGADKVLIGENWHDSQSYLIGDQFDSVMNYAFTKAMLDFFVYGTIDAQALCDRLNGLLMRNMTQVNHMMLNLIDCHDTHRFYSVCGKNEGKLLNALATEMFMPGAPMIYYGTELPAEGGYDPDNRRCFDWSRGGEFKQKVKELVGYKKLPALCDGDVKFYADNGLFFAERYTINQKVTLVVNNTKQTLSARGITLAADSRVINVE